MIDVMKLALETLEKLNTNGWILADFEDDVYASIDALRAAIEQAEQDTKTPLKVLDLTVRAECLLRRGRVYDVETLRAMDVRHLLAIPDFGKKALKEVSEALLKYELVTERRLMRKQRDSEAKLKEKNK
jgi:DNA-directed RNA polymerase alpha subunit